MEAVKAQCEKWGGSASCWGRPLSPLGLIRQGPVKAECGGFRCSEVPGPEEGRPSLTPGVRSLSCWLGLAGLAGG